VKIAARARIMAPAVTIAVHGVTTAAPAATTAPTTVGPGPTAVPVVMTVLAATTARPATTARVRTDRRVKTARLKISSQRPASMALLPALAVVHPRPPVAAHDGTTAVAAADRIDRRARRIDRRARQR
jgi:hypothetical protein